MVNLQPGMICYDDFIEEYYMTLRSSRDVADRTTWRLLNLLTGKEIDLFERTLLEDLDIKWLA